MGSNRPLVTLSGTQMNDLTIYILSAVEPPLPECVESARRVLSSSSGIKGIVYVKDVFPMSAAFNAMVERCSSRFIVQVDGDIVLEPWAVESLRTCLQAHPWAYMAWGQLGEMYDDGLRAGGAVRIWRRWPLRLFRFRDVRCVDRDLHSRIRLTGMRRVEAPADRRFGTHLPRQTPFARFSKAKGDCAKWLTLGRYDLIAASLERSIESQDLLKGILAAMRLSSGELHRSKNAQEDWLEYLKSESSSCGVLPMWMRTTD